MAFTNDLPDAASIESPGYLFETTRWTVVLQAGGSGPAAKRALEQLCGTYWYPLYAYARRRGCSSEDAQDAVQSFFVELLEKDRLHAADRERGRFRSFLLSSLKHFLANRQRDARRLKRGGGVYHISLDAAAGEARYQADPIDSETPERAFEIRWAMTLLEGAMSRLHDEFASAGKQALFHRLKAFFGGEPDAATYRQIAGELQMSEGAVKVASHRMRQRARAILREEIAHTVATPDDIDDELAALFALFDS